MELFRYVAMNLSGKRQHGQELGLDQASVRRTLERRGLWVLSVSAASPEAVRQSRSSTVAALEFFTSMAPLVNGGLPLVKALELTERSSSKRLAGTSRRVADRLEAGQSLSAAVAVEPQTFSGTIVSIIRAGELSGDLPRAMQMLVGHLDRQVRLRRDLLSALTYPAILMVAGILSVAALLLMVVPRLGSLLLETGGSLPRATSFLLAASSMLREHWYIVIGAMACVPLLYWWLTHTDIGGTHGFHALLMLPVVGPLQRDILASRFALTLGTLLAGGVPLHKGLAELLSSAENPIVSQELARIQSDVASGHSFHTVLERSALFPPLLADLVNVGESVGDIHTFLLRAGNTLDGRVMSSLGRISRAAEPVLVCILGLAIGGVALALLQALYGLNATIAP